jgi:hypothetical protein
MIELSDKEYDQIRKGVETKINKDVSDFYFYNFIAYLTPDSIILKTGKVIEVEDRSDMIKKVITLIEEESELE